MFYEHSREDLSLVLSTYMRWFTTICNSNSWGISYPFWHPWVSAYTPADIHIYKEAHTIKTVIIIEKVYLTQLKSLPILPKWRSIFPSI